MVFAALIALFEPNFSFINEFLSITVRLMRAQMRFWGRFYCFLRPFAAFYLPLFAFCFKNLVFRSAFAAPRGVEEGEWRGFTAIFTNARGRLELWLSVWRFEETNLSLLSYDCCQFLEFLRNAMIFCFNSE